MNIKGILENKVEKKRKVTGVYQDDTNIYLALLTSKDDPDKFHCQEIKKLNSYPFKQSIKEFQKEILEFEPHIVGITKIGKFLFLTKSIAEDEVFKKKDIWISVEDVFRMRETVWKSAIISDHEVERYLKEKVTFEKVPKFIQPYYAILSGVSTYKNWWLMHQ